MNRVFHVPLKITNYKLLLLCEQTVTPSKNNIDQSQSCRISIDKVKLGRGVVLRRRCRCCYHDHH